MAGKQHKREAKRVKLAARQAARRRERQRTIQTIIVIGVVVVLGAVVIVFSARDTGEEVAAGDEPTPAASPEEAAAPCTPASPPEDVVSADNPKPTFPDGPEQVLEDGTDYQAVVETSCGRIVFDLFEADAPETVNSFVFLAQQGFFDGLEIFRNATSISALQTGAGDNSNQWSIGYTLSDEFGRAQAEGGYAAGDLAMAKTAEPDSGGSQFFLVYGETSLPAEYTLFGRVVEGLEVLQSIGAIPTADPANPADETPGAEVYLNSVTIEAVAAAPATASPDPSPTQS